jgi:hypothetical protein
MDSIVSRDQAQRVLLAHYNKDAKKTMNPTQALKKLVSTPGWQEAVKQFYAKGLNEKNAGKARLLATPVMLAIMALSNVSNASTPEELINFVEQNKTRVTQQQSEITQRDLSRLESAIPFAANRLELAALGTNPSFDFFQRKLTGKIDNAMKKQVVPFTNGDPAFSNLDEDSLAQYVGEAFISKINNPQYASAADTLKNYLEGQGKTLEDLKAIAVDAASRYLRTN